jgi:hypothetical protein
MGCESGAASRWLARRSCFVWRANADSRKSWPHFPSLARSLLFGPWSPSQWAASSASLAAVSPLLPLRYARAWFLSPLLPLFRLVGSVSRTTMQFCPKPCSATNLRATTPLAKKENHPFSDNIFFFFLLPLSFFLSPFFLSLFFLLFFFLLFFSPILQAACCCGSAACSLCCKSCPQTRNSTTTRIVYALLLLLSAISAWVMLDPHIGEQLERVTKKRKKGGKRAIEMTGIIFIPFS